MQALAVARSALAVRGMAAGVAACAPGWWRGRAEVAGWGRALSEEAPPKRPTSAAFSAAAVRGFGQEPNMVRGLEKRTLDELKELHVDAVDEDEDEKVLVDGKHTFSWKDDKTGERGGPKGALRGAEPTRFGDWELNGRCSDF